MDPADRYTSHAWMRLEQERLWPRVWLMAGVATDDQIRFRHGPISLDLPDPRVRTEVFAGLTWICLDPDGPDLRTFLGPIAALLEPYAVQTLAVESDVSVPVRCNWKASVDAHNEGYHVHTLHPEVLGILDDASSEYTVFDPHARIVVPFGRSTARRPRGVDPVLAGMLRASGLDPASYEANPDGTRADLIRARRAQMPHSPLSDSQLLDNHMFYVFPNLQLNCYAHQVMLFRHRPHAHDPARCTFDQVILSRKGTPGTRSTPHRDLPRTTDVLGPVTGADLDAVEQLQLGMASRGFRAPILCEAEAPIAAMHRALVRHCAP